MKVALTKFSDALTAGRSEIVTSPYYCHSERSEAESTNLRSHFSAALEMTSSNAEIINHVKESNTDVFKSDALLLVQSTFSLVKRRRHVRC